MFVRKTLAAMNANVRPFSSVNSRVRRKMMLQQKGLPAFGTGIRSFLGHTDLTPHVLLLLDLSLDLRRIHMGQNMPEMSGTVRLTRRHIVRRVSLIRRSGCSLHQNFIALFRRKLYWSKWCHEVLAHGMLIGCCKN